MDTFKVGIIDDDSSKVTQIMYRITNGFENANYEKRAKYSNIKVEAFEIEIEQNIQVTVNNIIEADIDGLIVDYKLSSYKNVDYSGVDVATELEKIKYDFPIFVLTSYEDDLFVNEIFNSYQVFDFDRYLNEDSERIELNFKVIEQILKTKKQQKKWEDEILNLLPSAGTSLEVDSKLIDLDDKLEKSLNGKSMVPRKLKEELQSDKITELLNKLDGIIEKE
ncbi:MULTISPECIES: hypothetical protein [Bacillus]|uniref:hypothetical protein n=1 Tax=Bacillus TaxID=1386 RepID=UPI001CD43DBF|nr:hypothetical protein [Bacillus amyloliquefaciens]MCP1461725.1 hypothetical protein [Bacillus amyloliquefaciens]